MTAQSLRVGLIVPSSNTVMEPDFHRQIGSSTTVSTARIFLEDVTREAELKMLEEDLPDAIDRIRTTHPDVVVFGCTSAGALGTLSHDEDIRVMIEERSGAKALTVLGAVLMRLSSIRPKKLAVFTPYVDDLTGSIGRCLSEGGFSPVKSAGMGILVNVEIGRVTPAEIIQFVESQISGIACDAIFLSCTNWRAVEAIEALQTKLGVPVLSSNQAAMDIIQQYAAGVQGTIWQR